MPRREKYYYPLGIWAIKFPSRSAAAEYARLHKMLAFQWRGIGSFVTEQKLPSRKDIISLIGGK